MVSNNGLESGETCREMDCVRMLQNLVVKLMASTVAREVMKTDWNMDGVKMHQKLTGKLMVTQVVQKVQKIDGEMYGLSMLQKLMNPLRKMDGCKNEKCIWQY